LSPGGSTHLQTNNTENNTNNRTTQIITIEQHKYSGRVQAVSRLCEFYPGICLTTEEKARKNLSQGKKNLSHSTVYILSKTPTLEESNRKNLQKVLRKRMRDWCSEKEGLV
jgi:lipocalin